MLQEACHIKNTVVLIFWHIQCLHLMNSEVAWVLVSSRTQVQSQIILDPDYLSVSYDYGFTIKRICLPFLRNESVQYNAALAITVVIRGTSKEKL